MVFPVVTYGCESWTIKKAECQRIDAFKLWCWRRQESPLDSKATQPIITCNREPTALPPAQLSESPAQS